MFSPCFSLRVVPELILWWAAGMNSVWVADGTKCTWICSYLGLFREVNSPTMLFLGWWDETREHERNPWGDYTQKLCINCSRIQELWGGSSAAIPAASKRSLYTVFIYCERYILHVEYRETVLMLKLLSF